MSKLSTFQVYNASAGSGKTFTLVKEYLKILLTSEDKFAFQKILAVTFTYKAAAEMKERVLENLKKISEGEKTDILEKILAEVSIDRETVKQRSSTVLEAILQNYSAFSITTIDSFTHKIIKTFAFDLGLNLNFEVELDSETLLNQAVEVLISKIGVDKSLTDVLVKYAINKANDDKSWDIARDLNEVAKILLNESDVKYFRKLATTSLEDFNALHKKLKKENKAIEEAFLTIGEEALEIIKSNNLNHSEFANSGEAPNHFVKLTKYKFLKNGELKFDGRLHKNIEADKNLYAAKTDEHSKQLIDVIKSDLIILYYNSKALFEEKNQRYQLNKLVLQNLIPIAVLTKINSELNTIKEENNIRLIAEFNQLISDTIKDEPAPFIYERIGQKFMNYFIDEMQDTSELQWQNLIPLIANALAQQDSNLLLVGDGKQAIYRWRGGKAEQFINLGIADDTSLESNPFTIPKNAQELDTNYRSFDTIINFNNQFFQHASAHLENPIYKQLFIEGNNQKTTNKKGGFVNIDFLENEEDKEEETLKYAKKTLEIIENLDSEFSRNEVCVLVRRKKDAVVIANYLSEKNIDIVSSETLLLQNSKKVCFITDLLQVIEHPEDKEAKLSTLFFLYEHFKFNDDKSAFFKAYVELPNDTFFNQLNTIGGSFDVKSFHQISMYEKIEAIIRGFNLTQTSDAYIQFFLDVIFEHQQKGTSIQEFLEIWEAKKEKLSIVAPDAVDAVQIMTIHKSKGLEFPVVIFPYDIDINRQINPKAWVGNLPKDTYEGFDELLVSSYKSIESIGKEGLEISQKQQEELALDNFNLLYVALTRPIEQLYIVADKKMNKDNSPNTNFSSGVFIEYLQKIHLWSETKSQYSFGGKERKGKKETTKNITKIQENFISNSWQSHNISIVANSSKLWDTEQGEAIKFGNLIHEILSKIILKEDVKTIVYQYYQQGIIDEVELASITKTVLEIVNHKALQQFYTNEVTVFNEREIVSNERQIYIPDRLVFNSENEAIIIDYKTGKPSKEHHQQLIGYEDVLKSIHVKVIKKALIYINEEILVQEV